jgi:uncharacterized protein RhaS with RHS repeats
MCGPKYASRQKPPNNAGVDFYITAQAVELLQQNRPWYDELATGRLVGGLNTYAYVEGNPVSNIDPTGLRGGGTCSCPTPPPMPGSENSCPRTTELNRNMSLAKGMGPNSFYDSVKNKGRWDYKQQSRDYQDFGNFNFGATGYVVGLGPWLTRGAGWAQSQAGTSKPEWGTWTGKSPFGDDPADQAMIIAGWQYARCGCGG